MNQLQKAAVRALATTAFMFTCVAAHATGTAAAPNTRNVGSLTAPTSYNYSDAFSAPTTQTFYDDFTFSLSPEASFSSLTANINLGDFLGINNISARLYQGNGPFSAGTTPLVQAWSTPISYAPGLTGSTTVISQPDLAAGVYTLEIRGDVVGSAGGSYTGTLNLAPVPEPETYALMIAGLAIVGFVARRRNKNAA